MPVVWVLVIVAVVVGLILSLKIGVQVTMHDAVLSVTARAGPLKIRILPRRRKIKKRKKPSESASEPEPEDESEEDQTAPWIPSRAQIRLALQTLPNAAARMTRRILRGIRIHPLTVGVRIGGQSDPAAAADASGQALALVWTLMPPLERLLTIPAPSIVIRPDFDAPETVTEYDIGVTARIGTLIFAAVPMIRALIPILRLSPENDDTDTDSASVTGE